MTYKVVFEIQTEANDPLEAARNVEAMVKDPNIHWYWYVQEDTLKGKVFSVDLTEIHTDAVQEITDYTPLIK